MFDDWPFLLTVAVLFLGAMARGQAIYWLARVATEQALRHGRPTVGWSARLDRWLQGQGPDRGRRAIQRGGLVVVPLAYLTVGFQSLVMAGAGMLRLRWWQFTLAQVPGAVAWALIYSTIGFAVWAAALAAAAGSPAALAVIAVLLVAAVVALVARRSRAGQATSRERAGMR